MSNKEKRIEKKNNRILYIDILNIIAIFAVVILHQNGVVHQFANSSYWYSSMVIECVFYFAVPVFVMISGAMLLNYRKKYDTEMFFKKRVMKVLIPALFWIAFMIVWRCFIIKNMTINDWSIGNVLTIIFQSKEESTYYYIFLILGLYITMPVLSRLAKPEYRKTLWYLVGVFCVFNALIPDLCSLSGVKYNTSLGLMIGQYAMYAVLGYLLSTVKIEKKYRIMLYCLSIVLLVFRYLTTVFWSIEAGSLVKTMWGYGQFHTIVLASAVFVFVRNMKFEWLKKRERVMYLLRMFAECSFGVYLTHKIIMYYEVQWLNIDVRSIWWRTFGAIMTYCITVLIILILKKIPLLKKVVA